VARLCDHDPTVIALHHVLVATDFTEPAGVALRYGRGLARAFSATLHVVHVVDDIAASASVPTPGLDYGRLQEDLEAEGRTALDALLTPEDREVIGARGVLLTSHQPAQAILEYAATSAADLIVIGTHGRSGLADLLMGSVAQRVVRQAPCPVLAVHTHERDFVTA